MELQNRYDKLKEIIIRAGSMAVAFSGGVDSTFLLKVAHDILGDKVVAVTAQSSTYPEREFKVAKQFADELGVRHVVIVSEELEIEGFSSNPVNRCYYCKKELFTKIHEVASESKVKCVADGSNIDDMGDYRPGLKAVNELKVVSPLKEAGLTKEDIRALSKELGLRTWNKQPFACLASRFPYGHEITREKLSMVDQAEEILLDSGFRTVRVRHHENLARIEVAAEEMKKFYNEALMEEICIAFNKIGFNYVALDLKGYRTGSMNETIDTSAI